MEGPIYKFFRVRWSEAYYQLSPAERGQLMQKIEGIGKQFGVKSIILCNTCWNDEQWLGFGLEEFPDMETVHKHNLALVEADWYRYIHSETMLGTSAQLPTG